MRIRHTTRKYKLTKHEFYVAYHYALQYNDLVDKRNELESTLIKAVNNDGLPHSEQPGDPTGQNATKLADIETKIDNIRMAADESAGDLSDWILYGVTHETSYEYLRSEGMPCGRRHYYDLKRRFYYTLSKKI